jgi:hypothetical protein
MFDTGAFLALAACRTEVLEFHVGAGFAASHCCFCGVVRGRGRAVGSCGFEERRI